MGTAGMVPAFMQFSDGVNFLADGIGREILENLRAIGGAGPDNAYGIHAESLKRVYDDLLENAKVEFSLHSTVIDVETHGDQVTAAILAGKSGLFAVKAGVYVDGTGDGDICAWAGAPFEKGDEEGTMMPGTLCSLWASVDWQTVRGSGADRRELKQAIDDGIFTIPDVHLPGMWRVGETLGGGNIGHTFGVDSTDERSLTKALVWGRKLVLEFERYYKQYLKGYEKMELVGTGSLLGIRESRRIIGDHILCLEDFQKRAVFEDEIGRYCYPIDIHPSKPGSNEAYKEFEKLFRDMRYAKGESYGIPYRVLTPKGLSNVLVAGRCVSTDRYLQGSIRVMPGCYITGQAAGVAAAIAVERKCDTRGVAVGELQQRLKEMGAYLPNA